MVDINVLKKSYRSRPRTSVVILGVFGILIGLLCLFLTLCFDYFPSFFKQLRDYEITFAGETTNLFDFAAASISPFICYLLLLVPLCTLNDMANHRAFYLFFSIPAGILSTVYACCVFVETFPRLLTYIPYEGIDAIVKQIYLWIRVAYCALLLITSILACCYNSTYPFKYRQIYALRKARVKEADEGNSPLKKEQIKKDFYRYYKKQEFEKLLILLYRDFPSDPNAKMEEGQWRTAILEIQMAEASIREKEIAFLAKNDQYSLIRQIRSRAVSDCENDQIGQRKAKEDQAYFEYLKKNAPKENVASSEEEKK